MAHRATVGLPMSVKVMSLVFERYPNAAEMLLALALADHAHDDGTHIYPSVAALAKKTRRSERAVQYQLRAMVARGWLVLSKQATGQRGLTNHYVISEEWLAGGEPVPPITEITGANFAPVESVDNSPVTGETSFAQGCNGLRPRVKPIAPKPSLTVMNQTPLTPQGGNCGEADSQSGAGAGRAGGPDKAEGFDQFWRAWPDNEGKQDYVLCLALWKRKGLHRFIEEILRDVVARRASERWKAGYIEAPRRYLRGSRWLDKVTHGVSTAALHWSDTRPGIEAMGVRLGVGPWDEARFQRTAAQEDMFHVYAQKVKALADQVKV